MTLATHAIPPFTLRPRPGAGGEPAAWLLPGADPAAWLAEIARWDVPLAGVRLLILPTSRAEATPAGALALCGPSPRVAPRAVAYRRVAPDIYAPAGAVLVPPVGPEEIRGLVVWPVALFHPALGLVGCGDEELVAAVDLIDAGLPAEQAWDEAVSAPATGRHLRSVKPATVEMGDDLLAALRDDIGRAPPGRLPKLPQEGPGRRLIDKAQHGLARTAAEAAGVFRGVSPGVVDRFIAWARARADALAAGLDAARARELARLMKLLEADPDEGLRYALPLTGDATRGLAPPGGTLGPRDTSFSLGGLFSAAAADGWAVEQQTREKLRARYRELAARELALGRFRRAAYVFSSLLGDFSAAANALQQGKFWREAATLYRQKLNDAPRAAECLEKGGLVDEAIVLYLALGRHEKIGDLYRVIGRPADAADAYRTAAGACLARDDRLAAATLLEQKLEAPDEALVVLTEAWPDSKQATSCLRESYALLARLARHDEALRRLNVVRAAARNEPRAAALADVCASVATTYPAGLVRHAAADATRLLAGHALAAVPFDQACDLLTLVERSAGVDPLLARDTARYRAALAPPKPPPRPAEKAPAGVKGPEVTKAFTISTVVKWSYFTAIKGGFLGFGATGTGAIVRGNWLGNQQIVEFSGNDFLQARVRLIIGSHGITVFDVARRNRKISAEIPAANDFPATPVTSDQDGRTKFCYGVALAANGNLHWRGISSAAQTLVHETFNADGALIDSSETTIPMPAGAPPESLHLFVHGPYRVFTAGRTLYFDRQGGPVTTIEMPADIRGLHGPASPHAALRVVVDLAEGAAVVWPVYGTLERFAHGLVNPVTRLLSDGTLLAVDDREGRRYTLLDRKPQLKAAFTPDRGVVAVLPGELAGHFATITSGGAVKIYKVT